MKKDFKNKVAVVTVNYKTYYLIEYQLKILYEFNNPEEFYVIIVENSCCESEKAELEKLLKKYEAHKNIEIIYNTPFLSKDNYNGISPGSTQHGYGLDVGLECVYKLRDQGINLRYCLMHDPDWFWAMSNHLQYLTHLMQTGNYCALGGPYNFLDMLFIKKDAMTGVCDFPALFGCIFDLALYDKDVAGSLMPGETQVITGVVNGKDVGWRMRKYFSDKNYPYLSFFQNAKSSVAAIIGKTNTENCLYEYSLPNNRKIIAYHLLRGSQMNEDFYKNFVANFLKESAHNTQWLNSKLAFAVYIYNAIKANECRKMPFFRWFLNFYYNQFMRRLSAKQITICMNIVLRCRGKVNLIKAKTRFIIIRVRELGLLGTVNKVYTKIKKRISKNI